MSIQRGLTLVEVLVGVALFVMVALAIYQTYVSLYSTIGVSRAKIDAVDLANEQFEIARNLPYADVGVTGAIPNGKLTHIQTIQRDRISFTVTTTVRNVDDPFDGTIGGTPNDLSPADYKLVEIEITCVTCKKFTPIVLSGRVAPKGLETASTNGALFVQAIDANGQPVVDADVHIQNTALTPSLTIDDTTNMSGVLQIVDAPPASNSYQITVSKSGYSTDRTYALGGGGNPNPTKPHATVGLQQVTQLTFAIDRTSTLNVSTSNTTCDVIGNFPFTLRGSKQIGAGIYKYDEDLATNAGGNTSVPGLEWDTYSLTTSSGSYEIRGFNPLVPLQLLPNSTQALQVVLGPRNPSTLLVSVTDAATGLPLSGAGVTIGAATLYTGQGSLTQTDWSGGAGQATSTDPAQYESSTNISTGSPAGDATLTSVFGNYSDSGVLVSSAFDTGITSLFQQIIWNPTSQPPDTGANSAKFQVATSDDGETWDFKGPDGTSSTYYTTANRDLSAAGVSGRYAKYKMFLSTGSDDTTPNISDVSLTFTSGCVPPGQVAFSNLSSGGHAITVSKAGYTTYNSNVTTDADWQSVSIALIPQ